MKISLFLASVLILGSVFGFQESFAEENWKETKVLDKHGYYQDGLERTYRIPYFISNGSLEKIETDFGSFDIFLKNIENEADLKINIPRNYPVSNINDEEFKDDIFVLILGEETSNFKIEKSECYYEISIQLSENSDYARISWGHLVSDHLYLGEKVSADCIKKTIISPMEFPVHDVNESNNLQKKTVILYSNSTDNDCFLGCTDPSELFINAGSTVEWINTSNSSRSFSTGIYEEGPKGIGFTTDNRLHGNIDPNGKFSFLFSEPGEYQYFINEHRLLKVLGTIHVLDETYTENDTTTNKLQKMMEDENSTIPITSLDVNPNNSIITVGIDDQVDPNLTLDDYKQLLYKKIGKKFFKLEKHYDEEYPNAKNLTLPPLKQIKNGISLNEIVCKSNLLLINKKTDNSPACVKPFTAEKLTERGWKLPSLNHLIVDTSSNTDTTSITKKYTSLVDSSNQFAFDFYTEITNQNENIFFSPYSIMNAFAIVNEGTKGDTQKEIINVFGFPEDSKKQRDDFSKISDSLNQENSAYELQVANALWVTELYNLKPEFVETTKIHYDSQVESVDFVSDDVVNKMNSWVSKETNQKIKQILEPGSTDTETVFFVTNAIYFKGTWVTQFEEKSTVDDDFWLNAEDNVSVKMMNLYPTYLSHGEFEEFEILKLPYEGERLSMMILLPNQIDGLGLVEQTISNEKLKSWIDELDSNFVAASIPKFELETDYDLKELLREMGLNLIFDDKKADLSGIAELSGPFGVLHVNKAIHKAFVDVNEEGTEAAAVTAIGGMYESSEPPRPHIFKADHPFMFLIWDDETQSILFLGKISNPEGLG